MAQNTGATHIVVHPSLYLRGEGGKLQQQKVGQKLTLEKKHGERLVGKGFVEKLSRKEK